ncbi:hypothetical protein CEXT_506081 [Caerostris extrusa]|uniref:Uncharacterized protein n=1 Tax=Caerostris extrusa TaxID=172846 RepID=A0AAV4XE21_CAEEX|nr:hypothetical protein CEXT_506081 [Caerostris extrusa]
MPVHSLFICGSTSLTRGRGRENEEWEEASREDSCVGERKKKKKRKDVYVSRISAWNLIFGCLAMGRKRGGEEEKHGGRCGIRIRHATAPPLRMLVDGVAGGHCSSPPLF